ncbi:MAG: hypothetical protein ACKPKO_31705, partial [Candidatus Fonsibacter sp.]
GIPLLQILWTKAGNEAYFSDHNSVVPGSEAGLFFNDWISECKATISCLTVFISESYFDVAEIRSVRLSSK